MRRAIAILALPLTLAACRGEPVPRDYQNAPPAMTDPPDTRAEAPSARGMGEAPPQPTTGVEGPGAPYQPVNPQTGTTGTTITDTPPTTTIQHTAPKGR